MAIARVPGNSLLSDLDRQGIDLEFSTNSQPLTYMDFANFRVGINTDSPSQSLEVVGNILVANGHIFSSANISFDIGSNNNWFNSVYANSIISTTLTGILLTNAQPNITSVGTLTELSVDGNISVIDISGTLLTADQPNITSVGNLTSLTVTGQIVSTVADNTAPLIINSNVQVANLYATRASFSDQIEVTTSDSATTYYLTGVNASATGVYSLASTPQLSFDANTAVLTAAGFIGTLQTNAQSNITSLGTLTELTVAGNINVTLGNLQPSANLTSSLGYENKWWNSLYVNNVNANGYYGTILTGDQPNITTLANVSIDNLTVGSNINLPGNVAFDTLYADEIYEDGNRVVTDVSTINIVGDDVSGSGNISNVYVELSDTGVTAGIYGSGDDEFTERIPKITVDSKGRITNIANVTLTRVGNVNFNDTTISSNTEMTISAVGDIYLDAQGNGIVQISGPDAFGLPRGETFDRPENPEPGYIRFNTELQNIEFFDGNIWTGSDGPVSIISSETITPDGTSNTFDLLVLDNTSTNGVLVSINGTLQQPFTAYSIENDQIIFTEVPANTDIIEIRSLASGGVVSASQLRGAGANVIITSGTVNVSGNLIPSADVTYDIGSEDRQWKDLYLGGDIVYSGNAILAPLSDQTITIDSFSTTVYRTAKYILQATVDNSHQSLEILVNHNGTTSYNIITAEINTGNILGNVSTTISDDNVLLQYTTSFNNTSIRLIKNYIIL